MTEKKQEKAKMSIRTQVSASLAAGALSMCVGSNVSLPSSIIPVILQDGKLVDTFETASLLATTFALTAVPSSIMGGFLSDKYGRRKIALFSTIPILSGLVLMAIANSFTMVLIGRCLSSFGIWIGYPSVNVLVSEVVHPSVRGTLGVVPSIFISCGLVVSYLLGYLLNSWRIMTWILLFQPFLAFTALFLIKESPYWLIKKERKEEAESSLQWYRGQDYSIKSEFGDLVKKNEEQNLDSNKESTLSIIFSMNFLRAQSCSGLLLLCYQFTGIPALVMFSANIFQEANLSFDHRLAPVLIGITRVFLGILSSLAMKTGNRKYIFCFCSSLLSICSLSIAGVSYYRTTYLDSPAWLGYLPFMLILTMFMAHSFGCLPVMNLITAEVFPTAIRSLGNGTVTCLGMGGAGIVAALYPHIQRMVGVQGCFAWFSINALILTIYAFCIISDFRGLSLTNIERGMSKKKEVNSNPSV